MSVAKPTFPVTKNGTFFGYADADQIAANDSLELFDERKAAAVKATKAVELARADAEAKAESIALATANGPDPSAVKKAPGK